MSDVIVDRLGSIIGLTGMSPEGRAWIEENCEAEPWQWQGPTLNIDARMGDDIIGAMEEAGLTIE